MNVAIVAAESRAVFIDDSSSVVPPTPTERYLLPIWKQLLGVGQIGLDDSLLALGLNSLTAAFVCSQIQADLEIELGVVDVYRFPCVRELARTIDMLLSARVNIAVAEASCQARFALFL